VLDLALTALRTGGRLVVSSVDADLATLATWQAKLGGTLTRLDVARVEHAGEDWTSTTPVLQWTVRPR
jgi:precorrin-6B methylase 2